MGKCVIWVAQGGHEGSRQAQFLSLARHLPSRWQPLMVFLRPSASDSFLVKAFGELGVPTVSLNIQRSISLRGAAELAALVKRHDAVLIHSHHPAGNVTAKLAALLLRVTGRRVGVISGYRTARRGLSAGALALEKLTEPLADYVLCSSRGVEEGFFGDSEVLQSPSQLANGRRHWTLYNSVDMELLQSQRCNRSDARATVALPADGQIVLSVGGLKPAKGHSVLLDAHARVLRCRPDVTLVLVGDGPLRSELEAQASMLGIAHKVRFAGQQSNVAEWLSAADLFVLPSLWEGLPKALLEAIAVGVPAIGTDIEGVREVLDSSRQASVVAPGDDVNLAAAMLKILESPDRRRMIIDAQQEDAHRFDIRFAAPVIDSLYERLG